MHWVMSTSNQSGPRTPRPLPLRVRHQPWRRGAPLSTPFFLLALTVWVTSACTGSHERNTPSLRIEVAPLTLPGVANACYDLAVYNVAAAEVAPSALVWAREDICADRYGDGEGAITWVGTCDASPSGRTHTVSLTLGGLCTQAGCDVGNDLDPRTLPSSSYQNPCPASAPCQLERPCVENTDTPVQFNLTLVRDAGQGFFDVAVSFEDVFCSAKLDCLPALLSRPGPDGARDLTAVLAFACTSGSTNTCLYTNPIILDCGASGSWSIDPSQGPGNLVVSSPLLYRAATYRGDEAFVDFKKSYWNVALGLDASEFDNFPDCTLRWSATASGAPLEGTGPYTTPLGTYPFIVWERDILVDGDLDCSAHAVNVTLSGEDNPSVSTAYTAMQAPAVFSFGDCGTGGPEAIDGVCGEADGLSEIGAPTVALCSSGEPTAVVGTGPYNWSCLGQYGGDNDACSADRSCEAGTLTWAVAGTECEAEVVAATHGAEQAVSDGVSPTTGGQTFECVQGTWQGSGVGTCVASGSETFEFTGAVATFVVPAGVTSLEVEALGAEGGSNLSAPGGRGAGVIATMPVVAGETLEIRVGGRGSDGGGVTVGGYNGGAGSTRGLVGTNYSGAGGGGATDIRRAPFGLADRLLVAGGGGGAGGHSVSGQSVAVRTGASAGEVGLDGAGQSCASGQARGGTQSGGGAGAGASCPWALGGINGAFGVGGAGSGTSSLQGQVGGGNQGTSGGGGGGGWYGGGGAAGNGIGNGGSAGGGGGSSYAIPGSSGVGFTTGARIGDGRLVLTY